MYLHDCMYDAMEPLLQNRLRVIVVTLDLHQHVRGFERWKRSTLSREGHQKHDTGRYLSNLLRMLRRVPE